MRKETGFSFHQHTTPPYLYAVCQNVTRFLSHVNGQVQQAYITRFTSLSTNYDTLCAINKSMTEVCKTTHVYIHSRCHSKTCILDSSDVHIHESYEPKGFACYRIVGNFRGKIFYELVKNTIFVEKTFTDCSLLPCQRMPCPQISQRKLSRIATKPRNS